MDERTRALIELSAALARGRRGEWAQYMDRAATVATPTEIEEVLLQSYLFVGYPTLLQALEVWRNRQEAFAATNGSDPSEWPARGEEVFRQVYGEQHERLRDNVRALHAEVAEWMLNEGYGKVLSRPGLDLMTRELCIVALLVGQDAPKQLYSHMRGALNVGASQDDIEITLLMASRSAPREYVEQARATWERVRTRQREMNGREAT